MPAFSEHGPWNCFDDRNSQLSDNSMTLDEARKVLATGPM